MAISPNWIAIVQNDLGVRYRHIAARARRVIEKTPTGVAALTVPVPRQAGQICDCTSTCSLCGGGNERYRRDEKGETER